MPNRRSVALVAIIGLSLGGVANAAKSGSRSAPAALGTSGASLGTAIASSVHLPIVVAASRLIGAFGMVTSTFRSVEHNRAVGGVPNSYHLRGMAIDIVRRAGISHARIDAALRSAGYRLIESLDEGDHSHFAFAGADQFAPVVVPITLFRSNEVARWGGSDDAAPAVTKTKSTPPPLRLAADDHGKLELDLATGGPALTPTATR